MNTIELRQKIEDNLLKISAENLKVIDEFVEFLKEKEQTNLGKKREKAIAKLSIIMDQASDEAEANGLTPEILEEILADE